MRHRHLQYGISSPIAVLAAATQRTDRIALGTAVIPVGWENPLRLAEDLATVDVLSGGRLQPGLSVGPPMHWDDVRHALYPDTAEAEDFTYDRLDRLLRMVAGEQVSEFSGTEGIEDWSSRVEPHSAGLRERLWYGAGTTRSVTWAAEQRLNLLTSNVIQPDADEDFDTAQAEQLRLFKALHPQGRCSQGLVVIPTDSATPEQRGKYEAYVAARTARTAEVVQLGDRRMRFAVDLVGSSEQLAEQLYANAAFREVDEVVFALPFTFEHADYVQILTDLAQHLGPALGWQPDL